MKTLNVVKYVILVLASVMFITLLVYNLILNFQNCNLKRSFKNFELTNFLCDLDNQIFKISEDADVNVAW